MALPLRHSPQPVYQPTEDFVWDRQQQRIMRQADQRRKSQFFLLGLASFLMAFGCVVSNLVVSQEDYRVHLLQEKITSQQLLARRENIDLLAGSRLPLIEQLAASRLAMKRPDKIVFIQAQPVQAALAER